MIEKYSSARARYRRFAVLVTVAFGLAVASVPNASDATAHARTAAAPSGATLAVSPSTGLATQSVSVHWEGFDTPTTFGSDAVWVYQCKANPTSLSDCFTADPFPSSSGGNAIRNGVTGQDFAGTVNFEVRDATQLPELGCDEKHDCSIVAFDSNTTIPPNALPPGALVAPISFAHANTDCPVPATFDIVAGGEASVAQQAYLWAASQCTGPSPLALDFTESSSNNARDNLLANQTDVAYTSLAATSDELASATDTKSIAYAPISINAAVFAYNINDASTGQPITDLILSPRLVARLITDTRVVSYFQDPEFLALNPGHTWPDGGVSQPLLRAERNADTRITTSWMIHDQDAANFIAHKDRYNVPVLSDFYNKQYPVDNFEIAASDSSGFIPLTGELQGARHVFYQARPDGNHYSNQGYIGLLSRSNAVRFGLPMAKLVNNAGNPIAPDPAGLTAGLKAMTKLDGVLVPDPSSSEPNAYPLTKIDYAMFRTTVAVKDGAGKLVGDQVKAAHLKQSLNYAITRGQSDLALGYVPLPSDLVAATQAVVNSIKPLADPTPKPTHHTTTTTTGNATTQSTTPNTNYNAGSTGCCTTPTPSVTEPATTPLSSAPATPSTSGANKVPQLRYALSAPEWTPIANIGPIPTNATLPTLLLLGIVAFSISILWPALQRLAAWRRMILQRKEL